MSDWESWLGVHDDEGHVPFKPCTVVVLPSMADEWAPKILVAIGGVTENHARYD